MEKKQALSKAMALCAGQEYCEADVRSKLRSWGAEASDFDDILKELKDQGFVDDLRFAVSYASDKVRLNQWGRVKIRYMLSAKKISGQIIGKALDGIDEEVYSDTLRGLIEKKEKTLRSEKDAWTKKQKLIRFALGHGFETDEIIRILDEVMR